MSKQTVQANKEAIDLFLNDLPQSDRKPAIRAWVAETQKSGAQEKADIAYLQERFQSENDSWKRTWCLTALAILDNSSVIDDMRNWVEEADFEWLRYWGTVNLANLIHSATKRDEELKIFLIERIHEDRSPYVRAVALRLLVEMDHNESCLDAKKLREFHPHLDETATLEPMTMLQDMLDGSNWEYRGAACKALRSEASIKQYGTPDHKKPKKHESAFSRHVEQRFISRIAKILHNRYELGDVRYQAAHAMQNMRQSESLEDVIEILGDALKETRDLRGMARRVCVEALDDLATAKTKEALLFALEDDDAEIRQRAAKALAKKQCLAEDGAITYIIETMLQLSSEAETPEAKTKAKDRRYWKYIEALRHIDQTKAADTLSQYLHHRNPEMSERAEVALVDLGGETASRTLEQQRAKAVETYTTLLGEADEKIMEQFEHLMQRAQVAFLLSMWMHGIVFLLGVITLLGSLMIAFDIHPLGRCQGNANAACFSEFQRFVGSVGSIGSLGVLLFLFYQDPIRNIRQSVNNLVKVNVLFLGYVRRINQIDATFKQVFLDLRNFDTAQMQITVAEIEESVEKTLAKIAMYLEEPPSPMQSAWLNNATNNQRKD